MTHHLSDVEIAIFRVAQAKTAVAEQRSRIAFLRAKGHATKMADHLLNALANSLDLTKGHLQLVICNMAGYRYHLIRGEDIAAIHACAAANDAQAILHVTLVMDSKPADLSAEVWNGGKLVMRLPPRRRIG